MKVSDQRTAREAEAHTLSFLLRITSPTRREDGTPRRASFGSASASASRRDDARARTATRRTSTSATASSARSSTPSKTLTRVPLVSETLPDSWITQFSAHSNWLELSLRRLGYHDVFCHVGDACVIQTPAGPAPPLVTGTFGGSDFIHSLLGEATDHISEASVSDLAKAMDGVSSSAWL